MTGRTTLSPRFAAVATVRVVTSRSPCAVRRLIALMTSATARLPKTAAESLRRASCASVSTSVL
jgi:hypothetical protein